MLPKPRSLTSDPDFMKFWVGQSISEFGSQFSGLAIPYAATVILNATAFQFGVLGLLGNLAFLLLSLHVGVWVDRHRRRTIMIYSDLGRALILALVPIGAVLGFLSMNLFYFVALSSGVLTVFFEISYQSYVPVLVEVERLVDANGKLETTRAVAQGFGPTLAGTILNFVFAPFAVLGDTLGYFTSAGSLAWIRKTEEKVVATSKSTTHDIREGLHVVLGDRRLWMIAACTGTANLFSGAMFTIMVPYLVHQIGLSAIVIGLVFSAGAVGSVLGGLVASRVSGRIGVGQTVVISAFMFGLPTAGFYLASGLLAPLIIGVSIFVSGMGSVMYNVTQVSYRQALVPRVLLGRMNATMRFIVTGTIPIGSILGGALAQLLGYHEAIGLSVIGASVAFLWIVFSPVRHVREMPSPA